jgi:acetylornithine deacetylase/succinyl-diaminopimelate desuccinylase-like protein
LAAITEPTVLDFQIGIAQRSAYTLRVTTHGKSAHTTSIGKMRGINAVIKMSKVISSLENFKFKPVKLDKSIRSLFDDDRTCFMNIGPIKGGTERNMVPDLCELLLDVRALPGKNVTAVISEIKQRLNKLRAKDRELKVDVENRPTGTIQDAYALSVNHPLVRAASKHLNNVLDIKAELAAENGWTDGSILANEAHIPTIVCGPTGFPIYSPDEYVELDSEYFNGLKFYCSFAIDICGNKKSDFEQKYEPLQSSSKRS